MARYARKLTKQELIDGGIFITEDKRVFKNGIDITDNMPLNPNGYKILFIYDRDENGCCIKQNLDKYHKGYYTYKQRTITLNRALLAWFNEVIEDGLVSDHIDNNRDNYDIKNLQPLTPQENIHKNRTFEMGITETKCKMNKPREFYEKKLEQFLNEYEKAKAESNAKEAHHLRSKISQTRARLRYWDSHKEEYELYLMNKEFDEKMEQKELQIKKELEMIEYLKFEYKKQGDKTRWHQFVKLEKEWKSYEPVVREQIMESILKHF